MTPEKTIREAAASRARDLRRLAVLHAAKDEMTTAAVLDGEAGRIEAALAATAGEGAG